MGQKLYIGNLPYRTTENDVRELFSKYEPIHSTMLIADRETGRSRGFGFIELEEYNAEAAIAELGDTAFGGRVLRISKARQREDFNNFFSAGVSRIKRAHAREPVRNPFKSIDEQLEGYMLIDPFI